MKRSAAWRWWTQNSGSLPMNTFWNKYYCSVFLDVSEYIPDFNKKISGWYQDKIFVRVQFYRVMKNDLYCLATCMQEIIEFTKPSNPTWFEFNINYFRKVNWPNHLLAHFRPETNFREEGTFPSFPSFPKGGTIRWVDILWAISLHQVAPSSRILRNTFR